MESSQAVSCMKAFSSLYRLITFERINESTGYVIHIDGLTYESDRETIRRLASSLSLAVKEDAGRISIL